MTATVPVLTVTGVTAGYRRAVLHGITVDYAPGLHILLGPNGAGKTTLLRVMAGILPPRSGRVLIGGRNPSTDPAVKLLIGVAAHRAALAARLSVADNLRYWCRVLGLAPDLAERRVTAAMAAVSLTEIAGQPGSTLSRGQAQRVAIARALLPDPPVLLLDEPTSGVDPEVAASIRDQLRSLARSGRTIVVSSHELTAISDLADDVTVLDSGRIAGRGTAATLRTELVGSGYQLLIRGSGPLLESLAELGYQAAEPAQGAGAVVVVTGDEEAEALVRDLVLAGVHVREATPARNALEDIYVRLAGQGDSRG